MFCLGAGAGGRLSGTDVSMGAERAAALLSKGILWGACLSTI